MGAAPSAGLVVAMTLPPREFTDGRRFVSSPISQQVIRSNELLR